MSTWPESATVPEAGARSITGALAVAPAGVPPGAGLALAPGLAAGFSGSLSWEAAGVVRRGREGREHPISLVPEALDLLGAWLGPPAAEPAAPAVANERVRAKAHELAARLAPRMEAAALALAHPAEATPIFTPTSFLARRLAARAAA